MGKEQLAAEDFFNQVHPACQDFVKEMHGFLDENGYKLKLEAAKSGYVASYSHIKAKRVVINFVFRKGGLVIRIYGDHVNSYIDFLHTLPKDMVKAIEKSPACKRMLDPDKCNSRCSMGYDFELQGTRNQKCRYNCFMFAVNDETIPFIKSFVEKELAGRAA